MRRADRRRTISDVDFRHRCMCQGRGGPCSGRVTNRAATTSLWCQSSFVSHSVCSTLVFVPIILVSPFEMCALPVIVKKSMFSAQSSTSVTSENAHIWICVVVWYGRPFPTQQLFSSSSVCVYVCVCVCVCELNGNPRVILSAGHAVNPLLGVEFIGSVWHAKVL